MTLDESGAVECFGTLGMFQGLESPTTVLTVCFTLNQVKSEITTLPIGALQDRHSIPWAELLSVLLSTSCDGGSYGAGGGFAGIESNSALIPARNSS